MGEPGPMPAWHAALAYAVTGRRFDGFDRQPQPDVAALAAALEGWPQADPPLVVPDDLLRGIGPAQFFAALTALRGALSVRGSSSTARPVVASRPPDADERRLLAEAPPHHVS